MGFDDIDTLTYVTPSLATVHVPFHEIGEAAANFILSTIAHNQNTKPGLLPYSLIEGESL